MNLSFNYIREDKTVMTGFILSFFLIALSFFSIAFSFMQLPPLVPVFNQMPWGVERLGSKIELFIPLMIIVLITIFNAFFTNAIYKSMPLVARILCATSLLICVFLLLFVFRTLQVLL